MTDSVIPFNRASVTARDLEYAAHAVAQGHISGCGPFTSRAEALISQRTDGRTSLLTTSCTHALELSARLLNLEPGDEVLVPSFTFVSTAAAFLWNGARPVFVDIDPQTLNMDLAAARAAITPKTKAICIVHYAGVGCDPVAFRSLADEHGLTLIEDNAHGFGGTWGGRPLGTFGELSVLSFHETKNVTCGEGGAICFGDSLLAERAEILRDKGTDRSQFFKGLVDKYTWRENGSSWVMSDLLAAVLTGQLERMDEILIDRRRIWATYLEALAPWARSAGALLPHVPMAAEHPAHLFYLLMPDVYTRDALLAHLKNNGVMAVFHYLPLDRTPMGMQLVDGGHYESCPVAARVSESLVRLPLFTDLSVAEVERVVEGVMSFR